MERSPSKAWSGSARTVGCGVCAACGLVVDQVGEADGGEGDERLYRNQSAGGFADDGLSNADLFLEVATHSREMCVEVVGNVEALDPDALAPDGQRKAADLYARVLCQALGMMQKGVPVVADPDQENVAAQIV
jgi:hypothetical protein